MSDFGTEAEKKLAVILSKSVKHFDYFALAQKFTVNSTFMRLF